MARIDPPDHLLGATDFSSDDRVNDPLWLLRTLKATAWAYRPLKKAVADLEQNWARKREPGDWALAYLAFVVSKIPDIQPWHSGSTNALWKECGFSVKPPYSRVYSHFTELEQLADQFIEAAGRMIRHARRHEPAIGRHVHVDSTEAETHAALVHICCGGKRRSRATRPERESSSVARDQRQAENELPPDQPRPSDVQKVVHEARYTKVKINGHWYRTLDKTAGIRAYAGARGATRFWHGFYSEKAIDHHTGAVLAIETFNASTQEYHAYPVLYDQLQRNLGADSQTVITDKGFSVASVFEHNTKKGVGTVAPWRAGRSGKRKDQDAYDRHGIPRCKHCGGESRFVRFSANGGNPRLWFHCAIEPTVDCKRDQSISCSTDWRFLLPLWRTNPIYHELRSSHKQYERAHHHWRERYLVGPDNRSIRPKRRGVSWQRLRAVAAMVVEWIKILDREGWLGSARRNPNTAACTPGRGRKAAADLIRYRNRRGLSRPYGRAAHRLGLGPLAPPSASSSGKSPPGSSP